MSRRRTREIVFVCSAVSQTNELISKIVIANTIEEASSKFKDECSVDAKFIFGPFYKKKTQVIETTRSLQFSSPIFKRAEYNGWNVSAFTLVEPPNHAYLVFNNRVDNKNTPTPKGTIIVPISDLRYK